ncbi:hypothetical protein ZWY2020_005912, partial [Hordeum vulgare]
MRSREHSNEPENQSPAGWLVPENQGFLQRAAKGMDTSSESCKLQDEQYQYYKNLDDEKKYFLVLMLGDFQDAM